MKHSSKVFLNLIHFKVWKSCQNPTPLHSVEHMHVLCINVSLYIYLVSNMGNSSEVSFHIPNSDVSIGLISKSRTSTTDAILLRYGQIR